MHVSLALGLLRLIYVLVLATCAPDAAMHLAFAVGVGAMLGAALVPGPAQRMYGNHVGVHAA